MAQYDLSIIIPTFERADVFKRTLETTIKAIKGFNIEIIVINDSSIDIEANNSCEHLTILTNPKKGAASARNFGAASAKGSILLFVDNDVLISRSNIIRIIELNSILPNSCFNFFWFYPPDLIAQLPASSFGRYLLKNLVFSNISRLGRLSNDSTIMEVDGIASYFFSISKKNFEIVGGYEEKIPKAGVEDMIISKKLKENNIKMFFSYEDVVYHNEADRIKLVNMMGIYNSHSITRKIGVSIGYKEFDLNLSPSKKTFYQLLLPIKSIIYRLTIAMPNWAALDFVYFKMVSILLGLSSYEGYYNTKISSS